jgi:hypothetical protein
MRFFLIAILALPVVTFGHGGLIELPPASLPVSFAVWAGVISVIGTFLYTFTFRKKLPEARERVHVSWRALCGFLLSMLLIGYVFGNLPLFFWVGAVAGGMTLLLLTNGRGELRALRSWSLAPLILAGLFLFELLVPASETEQGIVMCVALYAIFFAAMRYVAPGFFARHELVTQLSTLAYSDGRTETHQAQSKQGVFSSVALIAVLIAGTSFDAFVHSAYWLKFLSGMSIGTASPFVVSVSFCAFVLLFILLYVVTITLMRDDVKEKSNVTFLELCQAFVPSFFPVAVGYLWAHNITRVELLFSSEFILYAWVFQVSVIIAGHMWGTAWAHAIAQRIFQNEHLARRSQYSMIVFMLMVTVVSIFMLQAPST